MRSWPFFAARELRCKCSWCGGGDMHTGFMARLVRLRQEYGQPMLLNSAFRCLDYDQQIGGAGVHPTGRAVDVSISGHDVHLLTRLATELGFTGIGFKQHGDHAKRFMHLDDLPNGVVGPRPWIWTYPK